ncbi:MAG: type II toxin-antitoxin system VapC family toxin [Rhodoferax sp.]|uniref:type II toxin-antitoxin system VapC family toxin n=1 Tax=Rhodoferax sp. TaxID=50421 RepID=UPI001400AC1C|nr:type II toxin-antitoxin system VapC family toxin [Rhodoferax sp.]NDP39740.1 type II toxin-antitoxin system VapC family toxin [Rhodoferax sp.]
MIILDTNVVSEPLKREPNATVLDWLNAQEPQTLYLTTVNLAELLAGVEVLPAGRRRDALRQALTAQLEPLFEGRILPFDNKAAEAFARVNASVVVSGNTISFADCAIAAIARAHGYSVATRNVRDFKGTGVETFDPWGLVI